MKVIVTGATGRLGQDTCTLLAADGHEIIGVDKSRKRDFNWPLRIANLTHREGCYAAMEGGEALVHLANFAHQSQTDAQNVFNHNVTVNMNVFQAGYELGLKQIVYASSIQAISGDQYNVFEKTPAPPPYFPLDDKVPSHPENAYALSKATGELQLEYFSRMGDIGATAIRLPWLFGKHIPEYVVKHPPYAMATLHRMDAASLIAASIRAALPGFRIYLPSAPDLVNLFGGAEKVAVERFPEVPRRQEPLSSLIDISHITREVGWTPTHALDLPKLEGQIA